MIYNPHPYQKFAEEFILDHDGAGVFLDMGLGKTVITLTAITKLGWDTERILIISPKRPAIDTWPSEIEKWDHTKNLDYGVAVGTAKERSQVISDDHFITIINRENIPWLVNLWKDKWPYDFVVIDELSSFKSSKSQRFRALKRVRKHIKRIVGLTGTPAGNGLMDLWPEVYLLDEGKALGETLTGYRNQFFVPGRRNGQIIYEWLPKPGSEKEILSLIEPFCVTMRSEDYLDLPEKIDIIRSIKLSPKTMKQYQQMETEKILELKDETIDAVNAAATVTKLLQICSGAVYRDSQHYQEIHDEKLEAFESVVEESEGENLLVFYQFKHEKDRIMAKFNEAVDIQEKGAVDRWKKGKIKMLLAHPLSAGHGLNLQGGGSVVIWYGLPMSLELYQQSVKRLHRQGQVKTVRNVILLCENTFEERVFYQILQNKEKGQDRIIDILRARIQEVKNESRSL